MGTEGSADRVVRVVGIVVATLFAAVVIFQLLLAAGVPWGAAAYGGQPANLPGALRITSGIAAVFWALVGLLVLRTVGIIGRGTPPRWVRVASWIVVGMLAVSVALNAMTPSAIERAIWFPTTVVMLAGMLVIVIGSRSGRTNK